MVETLHGFFRTACQTRHFTRLYAQFPEALEKIVTEQADWNQSNEAFEAMAQGVEDRLTDESGDAGPLGTLAQADEGDSSTAMPGLPPHLPSPSPAPPRKKYRVMR
ncbi:hypothetical protein BV25DRAFT_1920773 [Artomyces pyxidatus]|uniref:Uncharacterized protein n=1 Tax=Artomyces pyxidatus TaxID=48021 RepID=A0ACB8SKK3_9AGAM|nr:hypothetical protein BV25DRAFT_1920773 [Artomyces pyxidatus]